MKRLFAFILVLSITAVCLLVPVQAVRTSGTCGQNLTWSYNETTRQLTVTGTGPMDCGDYPQWMDLRAKATSIVIEDGVTSVSYGAFAHFTALHTVTLPASVRTIEGNAFHSCYKLKHISLEHIEALGSYSFYGCSSLKSLTVPTAVTEIPYATFNNCRGLQSVRLHDRLVRIQDYAFYGCNGLTEIQIPDSVTEIGSFAFYNCRNLTNADLGNGITALSTRVLEGCSKLETIHIPDNITSIGMGALSNCASLKEVYLGAGVAEIKADAFRGDSMLKGFSLSDKNPNFSVVEGVLYTKHREELVLFPYGFSGAYTVLSEATAIRDHAGYETGITALTIPGNVKFIGEYAFGWCENLVTLRLSEGLEQLQAGCFAYTGIQKVTIPSSVTKIGQTALKCGEMKQMVIYGEPPMIQELAFPRVDFSVFYPKRTDQWLEAHHLYGGLPSWELQCTTHSYANGACNRCGISDPKAADLTGTISVPGNDYATVQVQLLADGQTKPLRTYSAPVGQYLFPEILPGHYTLKISSDGCVTREYSINVTSGTVMQDITLHSLGDIDGNGKVNLGDVGKLNSHVKGISKLTDEYQLLCANVNGGILNMGDTGALYAHIRGTKKLY